MEEKNLSQKVLENLKAKVVKPKPRWQFLLKDYLVWALGTISLIIGSLAFSVIIHMFIYNDWDIYEKINHSLIGFILVTLPYFWLIFLALFILIAHYNIRHTKKGYRYSLIKVVAISILISMVLGTFFYYLGLGRVIDWNLTDRMPFYRKFLHPQMHTWLKAEEGFLMGMITSIKDNQHFKVIDLNRKEWQVMAEEAMMMIEVELTNGLRVRMIGRMLDEDTFAAEQIRLARPMAPPLPGLNFFGPDRPAPMRPPNF